MLQLVEGKCHQCTADIKLPMPNVVLFNDPTTSVISVPHIKGIECPNCLAYHAVLIVGYQITMALAPAVKPKLEEESKVLPFSVIPGALSN